MCDIDDFFLLYETFLIRMRIEQKKTVSPDDAHKTKE